MSEKKPNDGISLNPTVIATWLGIVFPLWGALLYGVNFYQDIMLKSETDLSVYVKRHELSVAELDAKIERTQILVAVYSRNHGDLTEVEKNSYTQAKARLIQLQEQRDRLIGI